MSEFSDALTIVRKHLKEDEDLYFTYQCNIALSFYDKYTDCKKKYKNKGDIHDIANVAASNFLDLLIRK